MDYLSGWSKCKRRLSGITAIVTGGNAGIGRETVLDLYLRGARVIMACRDIKKAEIAKLKIEKSTEAEEERGSLVVEQIELSNLQSVRNFVGRILDREATIHILINNAGVMMCPEGRTEDGFEMHMATNYFGHALLSLMLLPRLAESGPARIVFVASRLHTYCDLDLNDINFQRTTYNPLSAYGRSKTAEVLFSRALARKLREHNIDNVTTYSLHPGVISTGIARHFSDNFLRCTTWLFDNLLSWFLKSPRCGAQTTIHCAVDPACATDSGLYYRLSIDWSVRSVTK
ncbi:retinol dehydrogenase 11-like [Choristoneura fumiferana]|uniref:retinol dehydrogenase 11-like n=1 Tax=Choristoneura fumiferana TaxID=7141 RepID=UPI003D154195